MAALVLTLHLQPKPALEIEDEVATFHRRDLANTSPKRLSTERTAMQSTRRCAFARFALQLFQCRS
jgi:hypothetical protein